MRLQDRERCALPPSFRCLQHRTAPRFARWRRVNHCACGKAAPAPPPTVCAYLKCRQGLCPSGASAIHPRIFAQFGKMTSFFSKYSSAPTTSAVFAARRGRDFAKRAVVDAPPPSAARPRPTGGVLRSKIVWQAGGYGFGHVCACITYSGSLAPRRPVGRSR